jgi:hypothetical protein
MYCPSTSDKDRGFDRFGGASLKIADESRPAGLLLGRQRRMWNEGAVCAEFEINSGIMKKVKTCARIAAQKERNWIVGLTVCLSVTYQPATKTVSNASGFSTQQKPFSRASSATNLNHCM